MDLWAIQVPLVVLLAATAALGYLVGKWKRPAPSDAASHSRTDSLTGLSNRRGMDEALTRQFALMHRYQNAFAVALLDIDHFRRVNEERGRPYGDQVLCRVAQWLSSRVRDTDIVARSGGEEFAVIMPETDLEGACVLAERVRASLSEELSITVSGGVSAAMDGDAAESLLARADAALGEAKAAGRNRVFRHDGDRIQAVEEACVASEQ